MPVKLTKKEKEFLQPKFDEYGYDYSPEEIVDLLWMFWGFAVKMTLGEAADRADEIIKYGWSV